MKMYVFSFPLHTNVRIAYEHVANCTENHILTEKG